jgi:hypothetical protein
MADYMIVNGTDSELTNVNAGGVNVPKRSVGNTITLTDAELAAVCALPGVAVLKDTATRAHMRACAKVLQYRKVQTL